MDKSDETPKPRTNGIDPVALAKAFKAAPMEFSYTEKDAILYALGVIPCVAMFQENAPNIPGFKFGGPKILHGEHYMELFKPLPRRGKFTSHFKVADVLDKGTGLVKVYNVETFDESGDKVAFNQMLEFTVGAGNFGGKKTSRVIIPVANSPSGNPDSFIEERTSIDQAVLYRLSGDTNPLHIDPSFAAKGGLKTPILHGLCTFGHSVRHVMAKYANNDMSAFKSVKVRFVKPVLPGQTLRTEMWKGEDRIYFKTKVVETDELVISGGCVDLHKISPSRPSSLSSTLKSAAIFNEMASKVKSMTLPAKPSNLVFQWNIIKRGAAAASWTVDLCANQVYEGSSKARTPDCSITLPDETFVDLIGGKLDTKETVSNGSLKISGDTAMAQKLSNIFTASEV